jgi:L-ascorbate metabolism protein UlaG (beta-lactamase superfamily)
MEVAMSTSIQWLGHASFKISHNNEVIYIDPWKIENATNDATLVLVSHSHYDHYSSDDIARVSGANTKLFAPVDVITQEGVGEQILPSLAKTMDSIEVQAIAAYNPAKQFHPKPNQWLGFIIQAGSKQIYYAGDTDLTEEMKALDDITIALLPVGGTYTMNAVEAAEATEHIKPQMAIPYHWGDIVGTRKDAEDFAEKASCEVKILNPGQTLDLQ